ncbi:hypothetical protein [Streptomyces sp. NPDC126522]|uniref:hypothetical protein n=1 Tax=Streptomyces sp. NPDC126522 TaxID=3155211 RepID=UPI0033208A44
MRDLLASGWVIPVLDGLDEIFGGVEPRTVRALNQAVVEMPGFLLTCREGAFSEATDAAGVTVADATVVRFKPLSSASVTDYLTAGRTATDAHWDAVIKAMQRAPEGPLSRVLSVPLMAWLARSAYTHPSTRPDELCVPGLDEAALENLLLTRYFPAVYDTRRSGLHRFDAGRATKWLGLLAGQLAVNRQRNDWMWWELDATVRPSRIGLLISGVATILWWLALILGYTLPPHIVEDFTIAVTVPYWVVWVGGHPLAPIGIFYFLLIFGFFSWEKIKKWHILAIPPFPWVARIVNHLGQGMVVGIWQVGFLMFPLFATAVMLGPFMHALVPSLPSPGSFAAGTGVLAGVAMVCVFNQWMVRAGNGEEGFDFHKDTYLADSRTARSAVRRARRDFFTVFGFLTTIIVSASLLVSGRSPQMLAGAALVSCVISLISHIWPYYLAARVWLAMAGLLPWRLLRFLDDAAARGVLRRSGPSYQFRHARLQAHLAAAHPQQRTVWSEGPTRGRGRARRQSG